MATNFPASLDTLTNPTSSDSLSSPSHSAQHANVNDAVEALQAKVGADSSAVSSSLDYKVAQLEGRDTAGLVLVSRTTIGSAVSSATVSGAFSADYDAYKIVMTGGVASASNPNVNMTLGASTTGYYWATNIRLFSGSTITQQGANSSYWQISGSSNNTHYVNIDVTNPFATKHTVYSGISVFPQTGGGSAYIGGIHAVATSYTDFTLSLNTGTMTGGTIDVYGYVKS